MSDLLSAASLLLAVVSVLYGLWYPEITSALKEEVPEFTEDRIKPHQRVSSVFFGRAVPLSLAASTLALLFLPDTFQIFLKSLNAYSHYGIKTISQYDAVQTAFCTVVVFSASIAVHAIILACKLGWLRHRLRYSK